MDNKGNSPKEDWYGCPRFLEDLDKAKSGAIAPVYYSSPINNCNMIVGVRFDQCNTIVKAKALKIFKQKYPNAY